MSGILNRVYNYNPRYPSSPKRMAIWVKIVELHVTENLTQIEIGRQLGIPVATISDAITRYYARTPNNPITITLQSKINKAEKSEE